LTGARRGQLLLFTSVIRAAALGEPSGIVGVLDFERREVVLRSPVPESRHRAYEPNPRGGVRGARGVAAAGDRAVVASSDRLLVFDSDWTLVSELSHPWLGGIHDIALDPDGIWVTCANADLVVKVGPDGEILDRWSWRDDPRLAAELGHPSAPRFRPDLDYRDPRTLQGGVHNIAHVNGVARGEGSLLVSLGRILPPREVARRRVRAIPGRLASRLGVVRGERPPAPKVPVSAVAGSAFAIVEVPDDRELRPRVLLRERPVSVPNHNVLVHGGDVVYNDSNGDRVVAWDVDGRRVRAAVSIPGERAFARGLARLDDGRYLVGSQRPAQLHVVDLDAGEVVESIDLGGDPREAVYAVCVVPSPFEAPPSTLDFDVSGGPR
jgi:hypothetical protein